MISRFNIRDFDNEGTFYTDSNGREMISRTKGKNPGFEDRARAEQPVTSNYYPVTSQILIRDERRDLSVALLNDRSQGGSSLASGQIELMVHRRLLQDDVKGVGEPLDEKEYDRGVYVRGSHYLVLGKANTANPNGKSLYLTYRLQLISLTTNTPTDWICIIYAYFDSNVVVFKGDVLLISNSKLICPFPQTVIRYNVE